MFIYREAIPKGLASLLFVALMMTIWG